MIDFSKLSAEQRKAALVELQAQELAAKKKHEREIETYKGLVDSTVRENFPQLQAISIDLAEHKKRIREAFAAVVEMKSGLYGIKEGQNSHQFLSADGKYRIKIGCNMNDNYDDTVETGIAKVKQFIRSLASDENTQMLVDTILKLLSKDSKGTLKASRVLQLQQMADKSGNADFLEGVKIIRDAYRPEESKSYIRAEYKDANGAWVSVPLGMTEAE